MSALNPRRGAKDKRYPRRGTKGHEEKPKENEFLRHQAAAADNHWCQPQSNSPGMMSPAKILLPLILLLGLSGCKGPPPVGQPSFIDLTHPFDEQTIFWPTEEGFALERAFHGITPGGYFYSANRFRMAEHGGTHLDAPIHFFKDGETVDEIPLERLIAPGVVVDIRAQCRQNRDYQIGIDDFREWEERFRSRLDEVILLLETGFGDYWPDRAHYLGTEETGPSSVTQATLPGPPSRGCTMAGRPPLGQGHRAGYRQHRPRAVQRLQGSHHPGGTRHPHLRERGPNRRAASQRFHHRGPPHKDQGRQRRPPSHPGPNRSLTDPCNLPLRGYPRRNTKVTKLQKDYCRFLILDFGFEAKSVVMTPQSTIRNQQLSISLFVPLRG